MYNCEQICGCKETHAPTQLIVLTGGPGAGKTAVLEYVRKILCEHIAILPESAGILFSGGFWRLPSENARKAAQRAIYYVQTEMQNVVLSEKKWAVGLCDRGTIDGLAYWPGAMSEFFDNLATTQKTEYDKYHAIIHLRSPSLEHGYNYQNPLRVESAELAAEIDSKIHEVWREHPNYQTVESTTDFIEKIFLTATKIEQMIPVCCKKGLGLIK